jgi:hypothetical protein
MVRVSSQRAPSNLRPTHRKLALAAVLLLVLPLLSAIQPHAQQALAAPDARQQFLKNLVTAAIEHTHHFERYDPAYVRIPYPGGDVPSNTGVCTDVVIRSYRAVGIDLQKEVHEDMVANFSAYPKSWRWLADHPDSNIDHRRVPNLMVFFRRKGESLPVSNRPQDYSPGDLVTWNLGGGITHIGIVVGRKSADGSRYLIVHNIGQGPQMEDVLFNWKIIGHYRYFGPASQRN